MVLQFEVLIIVACFQILKILEEGEEGRDKAADGTSEGIITKPHSKCNPAQMLFFNSWRQPSIRAITFPYFLSYAKLKRGDNVELSVSRLKVLLKLAGLNMTFL